MTKRYHLIRVYASYDHWTIFDSETQALVKTQDGKDIEFRTKEDADEYLEAISQHP
jgi:hypothetical protein